MVGGRYARRVVRRPIYLRALVALAAATGLLAMAGALLPAPPAAAQAQATQPVAHAPYDSPLAITIETLTPSSIPENGPIEVSGILTNRDDTTWTSIKLYPIFSNQGPMTTRAELAAAALSPGDAVIGDRLTDVSDDVRSLAPGQSTTYSIRVPRSELDDTDVGVAEPGVYWFGVHASGQSADTPRDDFADGRARTFLPMVPPSTQGAVDTALVLPLRRMLEYSPDGSLADPDGWRETLEDGGDLQSLARFGEAARKRQVTWLVDPALPDAVRRLEGGNQPRSIEPTDLTVPDEPSPSGSPDVTFAPEEETGEADTEAQPNRTSLSTAASTWLDTLRSGMRRQEVLTLPYGDPDLAGTAAHDPGLYNLARAQTSQVLRAWGKDPTPAVTSPGGFLDPAALAMTDPDAPALLSDRMFGDDPPGVATADGHTVVVTSSGAAAGGPGPGDPLSAVGLRQRIVSEAALRVLEPGRREPLVVVLPTRLDPSGAEEFFAGLDPDWLRLTTVDRVADRPDTETDPEELDYPDFQDRLELDATTFDEVESLIGAGETLQNLLTRNDQVAGVVAEQALASASYSARALPLTGRGTIVASRGWIEARLGSVSITAPPGVTLSSSSGDFAATITNRLDQPVTVTVSPRSDAGLTVDRPEPILLGPDSRTTVLLQARTSRIAVHNVDLLLTDTDGTPLGASDRLPIRSAQVSEVIWLIMGTGLGLLFVAIVVRLIRRIRRARNSAAEPVP